MINFMAQLKQKIMYNYQNLEPLSFKIELENTENAIKRLLKVIFKAKCITLYLAFLFLL